MRLIDADVLMEILTTAIRNMKGIAKFLDAEDDPEIQMEIKAYMDIANGIKDMPTIKPELHWIPCTPDTMPEEREWIGTERFGTTISDEVYVTFKTPDGELFTKHLRFQNGQVPGYEQRTIDVFYKGSVPIAWKPLPKPYEPK